jgi:hypothetical protein
MFFSPALYIKLKRGECLSIIGTEGDPLFFEPDSDVPESISDETLNRMMNEVFNDAGIDPVITYAYHKTGLLVSEENIDFLSEEDIAEWNQAIEEAKELFKKNKA